MATTAPGEDRGAPLAPRDRIRRHSAPQVNARIDAETSARLRRLDAAGAAALVQRIDELDEEWDVDRALMANFAIVGGLTFATGVAGMRRQRGRWNGWLTFFSIQLGFLLWHAARGWCPPLPVFRRLGFRSSREVAHERDALATRLAAARAAAGG